MTHTAAVAMMEPVGLPSGTLTFLLSDVEGSTRLWEVAREAMAAALPRSLELVDAVAIAHGGVLPVEQGEGDSRLAAFERTADALAAAVAIQRAMAVEPWPEGAALRVRIALHSGDARLRDDRTYGGGVVHRAARLRSLARGGQVLVSRAEHDLVADELPLGQPLVADVASPLRYEGAARVQRGLTVEREETNAGLPFTRRFIAFGKTAPDTTPLLPDLVPTTPTEFHVESGWGAHVYFYGDRGLRHQPSCYPQETLGVTADEPQPGVGPLRCLRWNQGEFNLGDGPLELHNYPDQGSGTDMWQRVYRADGSAAQSRVGEARFSPNHGHLHYLGFSTITLHEPAPDGSPGRQVVRGPDKGICMVDVEQHAVGGDRTSPLSYAVPGTCDAATHADPDDPTYPGAAYFAMGISVGGADVYPWFIADQYLDITNVPDGRYLLRAEIDAGGKLVEKARANNVAVTCVELKGERATAC